MTTLAPMTATTFFLSILAYTDEKPLPNETIPEQEQRMYTDINKQLATLAKQGAIPSGWEVVWGPALSSSRANMSYIAGNTAANQYAVVTRGTDVSDFVNLFEDLRTRQQTPYFFLNGAQIANGTNEGLQDLLSLEGVSNGNFSSTSSTIGAYVKALSSTAEIYVTGHSLGGCLSTVLAPFLAQQVGSAANVYVYTYAAPSAGDAGFAQAFDTMFDATAATPRTYRYYNSMDCVPNAWQTLANILQLYPSPGPAAGPGVTNMVNCAMKGLPAYVQTGNGIELPGTPVFVVHPPGGGGGGTDPIDDPLFEAEALVQHSGPTYQNLLGLTGSGTLALKFL